MVKTILRNGHFLIITRTLELYIKIILLCYFLTYSLFWFLFCEWVGGICEINSAINFDTCNQKYNEMHHIEHYFFVVPRVDCEKNSYAPS